MALDRTANLSRTSHATLIGAGDLRSGVTSVSPELSLYAVGPVRLTELPREQYDESPYEATERMGVLALGADGQRAVDGSLMLAGGSVCTTTLVTTDQQSRVVKSITPGVHDLDRVDTARRHVAEARWLVAQTDSGSTIFPRTRILRDHPTPSWEMEFIPRYTLGERLMQGRESAASILREIDLVFDTLAEHLYWRRTRRSQTSYLNIVARRFNRLRRGSDLYERLWAQGATINGNPHPPIRELLTSIGKRYPMLVHPPGGRMCHGDLIFEDILPPVRSHGAVRFIDPNPQNSSPLIDVGKISMNLLTTYDLVYRDHVTAETRASGSLVEIDVFSRADPTTSVLVKLYREVAGQFEGLLPALSRTISVNLEPAELVAQAGLHSLALCAFHDAHHGARARAMTFAALGQQLLSQSIEARDFVVEKDLVQSSAI